MLNRTFQESRPGFLLHGSGKPQDDELLRKVTNSSLQVKKKCFFCFLQFSLGCTFVWDKKIDFMKEVLVAPLRRTSLFVGKILGGSTDTLIQIVILLIIGFIFTSIG
jgi:hypothetical protein